MHMARLCTGVLNYEILLHRGVSLLQGLLTVLSVGINTATLIVSTLTVHVPVTGMRFSVSRQNSAHSRCRS